MIPGASSLPWQYQLLFWMLILSVGFLAGICAFWLKRYLDGNDSKVAAALKKIAEQEIELVKTASELKLMTSSQNSANENALKNMVRHLMELKTEVEYIRAFSSDAKQASIDAQARLRTLSVEIQQLITTVQAHSRSLIAAQKVLHKHDQDIKTIVQQIARDGTMRISEVKKSGAE